MANTKSEYSGSQIGAKERALLILKEKCDIFYVTKKRTDIFTPTNMDSLFEDINRQVFVKRKIPEGRKVKFTATESEHLKVWLRIL